MAGLNKSEVRVAVSGGVYTFAMDNVPATLTALKACKNLGYTTGDGATFSISKDFEDIDGWQALSPLRKIMTGFGGKVDYTLRQFNRDTLLSTFGGTFTELATGEGTKFTPATGAVESGVAILMQDGPLEVAVVLPAATQTSEAELQFQRTDAVNLPHSWESIASEGTNGQPNTPFFVLLSEGFDA